METPIDIADTFYGTHFGDIHGWVQGCYAPKDTVSREAPEDNPLGRLFHDAAAKKWGQLHPYTGD
ncbi:hypothetical protein [Archangium sp.]|uniref:hypothetical protein n=1 Tax=Archangium sp. TaxID=1872627 RepID=UPI002D5FC585|nr:hypothetical protein [Archangium sp.]HYO59765.1 hypothetical protein [Archangium sp.]